MSKINANREMRRSMKGTKMTDEIIGELWKILRVGDTVVIEP